MHTLPSHPAHHGAVSAPPGSPDKGSSTVSHSPEDEDSILSYPDNRCEWDTVASSAQNVKQSRKNRGFGDEWDYQETGFCARSQLLRRISRRVKDKDIDNFLWAREMKARRIQRECFLLRQCLSASECGSVIETSESGCNDSREENELQSVTTKHNNSDSVPASVRIVETQRASWGHSADDTEFMDARTALDSDDHQLLAQEMRCPSLKNRLAFEWNTTASIFVNVALFCWLSATVARQIDVAIDLLPDSVNEDCETSTDVWPIIFYIFLGWLGLSIFYFTDTLYSWWAPDQVNEAFKFDLHNGLKLGEWRAKTIQDIHNSSCKSTMAYLIGQNLVLETCHTFNEKFYFLLFGSNTVWYILMPYALVTILVPLYWLARRGFQI